MFVARPIGLSVKQHAPQADRSKGPIVEVLKRVLPDSGLALEVGSGTGQHITHFARHFPGLTWQPSDYDQVAVASIEIYRVRSSARERTRAALLRCASGSGSGLLDAVLAINLVHVTSWSVCEGLFDARAGTCTMPACSSCMSFRQEGSYTSTENARLDARCVAHPTGPARHRDRRGRSGACATCWSSRRSICPAEDGRGVSQASRDGPGSHDAAPTRMTRRA